MKRTVNYHACNSSLACNILLAAIHEPHGVDCASVVIIPTALLGCKWRMLPKDACSSKQHPPQCEDLDAEPHGQQVCSTRKSQHEAVQEYQLHAATCR